MQLQNTQPTKYLILLTIIFMDLLTGMEFDIFVPSFPQLQGHFDLTPFWVEALLSVNMIGYCLSLFVVGHYSDRYGRKNIILIGLVTFIVGCILCLLTDSYYIFLAGRFLQGVGVAGPAILSFLIIADAYPVKEQQFLMAMLNASMNIAVGLAPVVGSYLTLYFNWQGNFVALLVLGLLILLMTILFIPQYKVPAQHETLTLPGYRLIFTSKPLMLLIITFLFLFVPYWIFVGMSPLLYMQDLKVSLAHFGYYQGVLAFAFAMGSLLYGFYIKHVDYHAKAQLIYSIGISITSLVIFAFLTAINSTSALFITFGMLVLTISHVIPSTILYPICLNYMPQAKGKVSAIIQGSRLIVTAMGLQVAGYFYQGSFQSIGVMISSFMLLGIVALMIVVARFELE